jgi:prepilin-type processing-associated H-X9-DG protein
LGGFREGNGDNIPLAFDKYGNHTDYLNVLFMDGHVLGYPDAASGSCEDIIIFLNKEHKYPDKLFKQLLSKAKKIDHNLHFY